MRRPRWHGCLDDEGRDRSIRNVITRRRRSIRDRDRPQVFAGQPRHNKVLVRRTENGTFDSNLAAPADRSAHAIRRAPATARTINEPDAKLVERPRPSLTRTPKPAEVVGYSPVDPSPTDARSTPTRPRLRRPHDRPQARSPTPRSTSNQVWILCDPRRRARR